MTREETIANLNMISVAFVEPVTKEQRKLINDTFEMAIQALSQEPTERELGRDYLLQSFVEALKVLQAENDDLKEKHKQEPCKDAVSRDAVEQMIKAEMPERGTWEIGGNVGDIEKQTVCEVCVDLLQGLNELPSVNTQYTGNEFFNFDAPMVKKSMEQDAVTETV